MSLPPLWLSIALASLLSLGRIADAQGPSPADANLRIVCLARESPGGPPVGGVEQDQTPLTAGAPSQALGVGGTGWSCDAEGTLVGPRITHDARIQADALALESNAFLTYELIVRDPTGLLGGGSLVPLQMTALTQVDFAPAFTGPSGAAGGTLRAFVQGDPFGVAPVGVSLDVLVRRDPSGADEEAYSCDGVPASTGSCRLQDTLVGFAPVGAFQGIALGFDFDFDGVATEVNATGLADPVIEIDPDAEFAPGMRYVDFAEIELSPGVVQQVPEPGNATVILAAAFISWAASRRDLLR